MPLRSLAVAALAGAVLSPCTGPAPADRDKADGGAARPGEPPAAKAEPAAAPEPDRHEPIEADRPRSSRRGFGRSGRCGECHEQMRMEWLNSAHARATQSTAYQTALLRLGETERALCASCHAPGLPFGQDPAEGVPCDGCHTLSAVTPGAASATPRYDVVSGRKYGPLVGPASNYFHGMAHSELHEHADLCAACHHLMTFTAGGETRKIPVVTDYSGWKRYAEGRPCQACHMPPRGNEPVARGAEVRPDVPSHSFPGAAGKTLRMEVAVDPRADQLTVELTHGAGHPLPSGLVDRRLLLRVAFTDRGGVEIGGDERAYGIFLIDGEGRPAPFFRAVGVKEDRRLLPGRTHTEQFSVPQGAVRATLSLLAAPTAPELRASYGEPDLKVLRSATLPLRLRARRRETGPGPAEGAER